MGPWEPVSAALCSSSIGILVLLAAFCGGVVLIVNAIGRE